MVSRQQLTRLSKLSASEIADSVRLAWRMHELVKDHPDFDVLCEPSLTNYCFRYLPNGLVERQEEPEVQKMLNGLNREIVESVRRSGFTSVMTAAGERCIAIQICLCETVTGGIDATFEAIARWGRLLTRTYAVSSNQPVEMEVLSCSSESCSSPMEV